MVVKLEISLDPNDRDDLRMFVELIRLGMPAGMERTTEVVARATDDHARYLVALMIESLQGAETYEQWLKKCTAEVPRVALLRRATGGSTP